MCRGDMFLEMLWEQCFGQGYNRARVQTLDVSYIIMEVQIVLA